MATSGTRADTASARARAPTPGGKDRVGRSPNRIRSTGMSAVRHSAATPAVVPTDSTSSAAAGTARTSVLPALNGT